MKFAKQYWCLLEQERLDPLALEALQEIDQSLPAWQNVTEQLLALRIHGYDVTGKATPKSKKIKTKNKKTKQKTKQVEHTTKPK